jgi:hypothetical protein
MSPSAGDMGYKAMCSIHSTRVEWMGGDKA